MDFHPYGELLASGSLDTAIKLWDIRRKGCIFTYKGHNRTVNSLKFSPDGQWIASAGEEGMVKVKIRKRSIFYLWSFAFNDQFYPLLYLVTFLISMYIASCTILCTYVRKDIDICITFKLAVGPEGR